MRLITTILLGLIITSCNPFLSKDLRNKNKCNRKLKREVKRHDNKIRKISLDCPEIVKQDTIRDTLILEVPKVKLDSFIVIEKDTQEIDSLVNLIKDTEVKEVIREYIIKYKPIKDTVVHLDDGYTINLFCKGGNIHYSISKPKQEIEIPTETIITNHEEIKLSFTEKVLNAVKNYWWVLLLALLSLVLLKLISRLNVKRFFNNE